MPDSRGARRSSLIAFVNDATSRLMAARGFWPAETTEAYMRTLREYLERHGRQVALHSDRHSIFRLNRPDRQGELPQFTRAVKALGIDPVHAHILQAKGRIERAYRTLQVFRRMQLRNWGSCQQLLKSPLLVIPDTSERNQVSKPLAVGTGKRTLSVYRRRRVAV